MDLRYETLIFDLDGTISDPFVGISRSINYALETLSYDPVDPETVRPLIGPPLTEIFGHLLGTLPEPEMLDLVDRYRERYASVGYAENEIYQDIPQTIARLAESGYRMGVCTSKREDYARRIVEMFGLSQYFSFVDGGGVGVEKRQQIEALVANGVPANTAVMIGDRAVDILAGKTNDMASAGVLWGFGERLELEAAAPDHLLESPADLLHVFGS
jgi:phosphoglycolate phosphatase